QRARAEAAVPLVEEEAEEVVVAVELDDVPGKLVRLVDLRRARRDPVARERPHEVAELPLLVAELVPGHGVEISRRRGSGRGRPSGRARPGRPPPRRRTTTAPPRSGAALRPRRPRPRESGRRPSRRARE